jgi:hypothetical protein
VDLHSVKTCNVRCLDCGKQLLKYQEREMTQLFKHKEVNSLTIAFSTRYS